MKLRLIFCIAILIGFIQVNGFGQSLSGNWNTAGNWTPNGVPSGTGTNVSFTGNATVNGGNSNVIGNITAGSNDLTVATTGPTSAGTLTLGSSALFNAGTKKNLTFTTSVTVTVNSGGILEIWGDLIFGTSMQLDVKSGGQLIVHGNVSAGTGAQLKTNGSGTVSVSGTIALGSGGQISGPPGSISAHGCTCTGCSTQCTSGTLPVTLLGFNATLREKSVLLSWSTASEQNFDFFDVEHSSNAKDFFSIGKVAGHGTSNIRNDYSLVDEKPLIGKNYYRLKSVDFDYYTEYFNVIAVDYSDDKRFFISPNPSDGISLGFNLNFTPDGNTSIIVYDNLSNVVGYYAPTDNTQSITFTNSLKGGVYYAKIVSGDFVKVERFIVR